MRLRARSGFCRAASAPRAGYGCLSRFRRALEHWLESCYATHVLGAPRLIGSLLFVLGFWAACNPKGSAQDGTRKRPQQSGSEAPVAEPGSEKPIAGESAEIAGGEFWAGSRPGTPGRKPDLEPRRYQVELGPFEMDRLLYPNDPKKPPLTNVTRSEAKKLCAARGARLCTELEWERACKGPDSHRFISGDSYDESCSKAITACASAFEVFGLGTTLREWVSSDLRTPKQTPLAVVRGPEKGAPAHAHRCAHRRGIDANSKHEDVGFRCCRGAPNAAIIPEPKLTQTFRKTSVSAKRLEELLSSSPHTSTLAKDVQFFREPDAARTVVARGPGDRMGFDFTVSPLFWNPVAGAEYLAVAARSGKKTSFVVLFERVTDKDYELSASFVMQDEPGPVAFAYSQYIRPRFHFSTCWGCPGENGKILHRKPDSVVILQP